MTERGPLSPCSRSKTLESALVDILMLSGNHTEVILAIVMPCYLIYIGKGISQAYKQVTMHGVAAASVLALEESIYLS